MGADGENKPTKQRLIRILKNAASKAIAEDDPWGEFNIHLIPAERVIRHIFNPETKTWSTDETIVKIEKQPFTHGAMRFCYRMKKMATPPAHANNHRFHAHGWSRASNYVAKAYHHSLDGIDTSNEAKLAVQNDIMLQYEAAYWAERFNAQDPPKKIVFIRAYALEFPDREGQPWFAVERYIAGTDSYGCGFTKHNTNSGYVNEEQRRVTPQVFSAFTFYASQGTRLVADIQGVGDLFTDPQVLSNDYRFGDGDLGPRGMALFFKTFSHNSLADAMGIPVFPLSRNELKHQTKLDDDTSSQGSDADLNGSMTDLEEKLNRFALLDLNRNKRKSVFVTSPIVVPAELQDTERRSNTTTRETFQQCIRSSISTTAPKHPPKLNRTASDIDEVQVCLQRAKQDYKFDLKATFNRNESGELSSPRSKSNKRASLAIRRVSGPMMPTNETRENLGKVHYQLAVLHGMHRFPEVVPSNTNLLDDNDKNNIVKAIPRHDVFSVLFHLSYAASLRNVPACLSLGRVQAGLGTIVSNLLEGIVPIDFEASKDLFRRCMESPYPPAAPKAAAGCLLYQILLDERQQYEPLEQNGDEEASSIPTTNKTTTTSPQTLITVLTDTIALLMQAQAEKQAMQQHQKRDQQKKQAEHNQRFQPGDRVEADYCLEGTFYPGIVEQVVNDNEIVVMYDDDGSTEHLSSQHVRLIVPPTATQTVLGGPLSDEEALGGGENSDAKCLMEAYELQAELAELKEQQGDMAGAAELYEQAADGAMAAGKMQSATKWSLKAGELAE